MTTLQRDANTKIVIIGAGVVGCNMADRLSELGMKKITVVDQGPLFHTGGSSSHAPGIVFQTNGSQSMMRLAMHSVKKFGALRDDDGKPVYMQTGGIEVATTPERMRELHRKYSFARSYGAHDVEMLTPEQVVAKSPWIDEKVILGGFYNPSDGIAPGVKVDTAISKRAVARGVVFKGETTVKDIIVKDGAVKTVVTDKGDIEADLVVCCVGIWGPNIGKMVGVTIPLQPLEHQLAFMKPHKSLTKFKSEAAESVQPVLRHQDKSLYFKQVWDTYVIGSYQHRAMPVQAEDIKSPAEALKNGLRRNEPSIHKFTPEDFTKPFKDSVELLPNLAECELDWAMNGMFSFTEDGMSIFGESSKVKGFWSAEAVWLTHSGGAGDAMAEWIALGRPGLELQPIDLREHHIDRFEANGHSPSYIRRRANQNYIEVYDILHPLQSREDSRPIRTSPFYEQQKALAAEFFVASSWERPQWYNANYVLDKSFVPDREDWAAQFWSPIAVAEHKTMRERVGMVDMTGLKKVEVSGKNATALLNKLTTGKMNMKVGTVTYTLMLNEQGGIRSDITVGRLEKNLYQLGINGNMDIRYMKDHAEEMGDVAVHDISTTYCCIGLWGPKAREVVQSISENDWSNEGHGFFKIKESFIKEVPVRAMRLSYVGELGWEIYTTQDYGRYLWDVLWEAGQEHGLIAVGRAAFDAMRLEKGYRSWGKDMWTEHDPFEAGLGFAVRMDKEEFIGKTALEQRQKEGLRQQLRTLTFDEADKLVIGNSETVFDGEDVVGFVTSSYYGASVGKGMAYAWLNTGYDVGDKLEVLYLGNKLAVTVTEDTLFDPDMTRMREPKKTLVSS